MPQNNAAIVNVLRTPNSMISEITHSRANGKQTENPTSCPRKLPHHSRKMTPRRRIRTIASKSRERKRAEWCASKISYSNETSKICILEVKLISETTSICPDVSVSWQERFFVQNLHRTQEQQIMRFLTCLNCSQEAIVNSIANQ